MAHAPRAARPATLARLGVLVFGLAALSLAGVGWIALDRISTLRQSAHWINQTLHVRGERMSQLGGRVEIASTGLGTTVTAVLPGPAQAAAPTAAVTR